MQKNLKKLTRVDLPDGINPELSDIEIDERDLEIVSGEIRTIYHNDHGWHCIATVRINGQDVCVLAHQVGL